MGYTASDAIERIKLKAFTSTSSSLTDPQLLTLLDDSLRSYIVPFTKALRDEWFVGKSEIVVTVPASNQIELPDTVASTLRTVAWSNGGQLMPLDRIEPEAAFPYLNQGSGSLPVGYMLRGYTLMTLPPSPGVQLSLTAMRRPPEMVLEEDAAEISTDGGAVLTLESVPLAWQSQAPTTVDVISGDSPFSPIVTSVSVVSLVGNVLTLGEDPGASAGDWVSDPGTSPFPNIPIELHPLLEVDVIATLFQGLGDKRLAGILERKKELETSLRKTAAPRMQGSSRPIVNSAAPGMRSGWGFWGRR